jgi:hypothetical protein
MSHEQLDRLVELAGGNDIVYINRAERCSGAKMLLIYTTIVASGIFFGKKCASPPWLVNY